MSFLVRNTLRGVNRSLPRLRKYSAAGPTSSSYTAEQEALQHHAAGTTDLWRKISYYVCAPGIATCIVWVYNAEAEHAAHLDHLRVENDGQLPEVPAFDYMNRRSKPYPWGINSLFFNPHTNKDLSGEAA